MFPFLSFCGAMRLQNQARLAFHFLTHAFSPYFLPSFLPSLPPSFLLQYAGFTGVRLGWTVVPKQLKFKDGSSVCVRRGRKGGREGGREVRKRRKGKANEREGGAVLFFGFWEKVIEEGM